MEGGATAAATATAAEAETQASAAGSKQPTEQQDRNADQRSPRLSANRRASTPTGKFNSVDTLDRQTVATHGYTKTQTHWPHNLALDPLMVHAVRGSLPEESHHLHSK